MRIYYFYFTILLIVFFSDTITKELHALPIDFKAISRTLNPNLIFSNRPFFTSDPVTEGEVDKNYIYNISTADEDNKDKLKVTAIKKPNFLEFKETGKGKAQLKGMPADGDAGSYQVQLEVSDGNLSADQNFVLEIESDADQDDEDEEEDEEEDEDEEDEEDDQATVLKFLTQPSVTEIEEEENYQYNVQVEGDERDLKGREGKIQLSAPKKPKWLKFSDEGEGKGKLSGTSSEGDAGNYEIIIEAEQYDQVIRQTFNLEVNPLEENVSPEFTSNPIEEIKIEEEYVYEIVTIDQNEDDELRLRALELPRWLFFDEKGNGDGVLKGNPKSAQIGSWQVLLQVSDGSATAQQGFIIEVLDNEAPVFTSDPPTSVIEGDEYIYEVTTSDVEEDKLEIKAVTLPNWLNLKVKNNTATLKGTPDRKLLGDHSVTLEVSDKFHSTRQNFTINVIQNQAPQFTSQPVKSIAAGINYQYDVNATDPENDPLELKAKELPSWLKLVSSEDGLGTISGMPEPKDEGSHQVILELSDGINTIEQNFTVVVNPNQPPSIDSDPILNATVGIEYQYNIIASDPESDEISFSAEGLPAWLSLDQNGAGKATISGTSGEENVGNVEIKVIVKDVWDNETTQNYTIEVSMPNQNPEFTTTPVNNVTVGEEYLYQFEATDPDPGDELSFKAEQIPGWLAISDLGDGTGNLKGTPDAVAVGEHEVVLLVEDQDGASVSQRFKVTVLPGNAAPVFASTPITEVYEDNAYEYDITVTDANEDVITIEVSQKPGWLTYTELENGKALLQGTPSNENVGSYNLKLTATDNEGKATDQEFSITVINTNDPPVLTSSPPEFVPVGKEYNYTITVEDPDPGEKLTFKGIELPSWLTISSVNTFQATLKGTPDASFSGKSDVIIEVVDKEGASDRQSFTITVNSDPVANNISVNILEDEPYVFLESDFNQAFLDPDDDELKMISIEQLPAYGKLQLLSGEVSKGQEIDLQSVPYLTYTPAQDYYGEDSLIWMASDGSTTSNQALAKINISAVNDPPMISNVPSEPIQYAVKRGQGVKIAPDVEITDVDTELIQSGRVFIQRNFISGEDILQFERFGEIEVNYNQEAGILTLTGKDTPQNYQKMMRSVKYFNNNVDNPKFITRQVSFAVDDGLVESEWVSRNIEVQEGFLPLDIPSAFTPDGDGKNDRWIIENIDVYPECEVQIFSRWGKLVYSSKGYLDTWDGNYNGSVLPAETYFYVIRLNEFSDNYQGTVTLIR